MSRKLLMYKKNEEEEEEEKIYIKNTTNAGYFRVGVGDDTDISETIEDGIITLSFKGNTKILDTNGSEVVAGTDGATLVSLGDLQDEGNRNIEILSVGKNLLDADGLIKDKKIASNGAEENRAGLCCSDFIKVKKNTNYSIRKFTSVNNGGMMGCYGYDINKNCVNSLSSNWYNHGKYIFNTGSCEYIRFTFNFSSDYVVENCYMVSEGNSLPEDFVTHNSNKTQILLDEPLRKINDDICDELLEDGTLIRRCGEVVLNGDEEWFNSYSGWDNCIFCCKSLTGIKYSTSCNVLSDGLAATRLTTLAITPNLSGIATHNWSNGVLQIAIQDVKSVDELKLRLSENPVTLIYELTTPVIENLTPAEVGVYKNNNIIFYTQIEPSESTHIIKIN